MKTINILYLIIILLFICLAITSCETKPKPISDQTMYQSATPNTVEADAYCNTCNCTCTNAGTGNASYKGKTVNDVNFRTIDITNYNFDGATLLGCRFDNMSLKDVSFKGATFGVGSNGAPCSFAGATLDNVCFVSAQLDSTDFQFSTFKGSDFTCADIFNTKFGFSIQAVGDTSNRTNFSYATIGVGEGEFLFPLDGLTQTNWASTNFTNTKFLGLTQSRFHPSGKNMTDAKIAGINLEYFDISHANLTRVDLSGAELSYANMDTTICYGGNFSSTNMTTVQAINSDFYDDTNGGSNFQSATLTKAIFTYADMEQALLSNANLSGIQARHANFQKSVLIGAGNLNAALVSTADFSYSNFSNASVNQVDFSGTMLINIKFESNSTLAGTNFSGAIMPSASFFSAYLQDINFTAAYLYNSNFSGSTLTGEPNGSGVNFQCAQLGGSNLSATVNKAIFYNAVIPPDTACCPQITGVYCGTVPWTGNTFGHTILPSLKNKFYCPNGARDTCSGEQWVWNPKNSSICTNWEGYAPWSKPSDCDPHDTSHIIIIKDPNLKKCLDKQLFNGQDQPIDSTLAAAISSISCCCLGIKDLSGLEHFTNLEYLDVEGNELVNGDFSNLSNKLQTLKVSDNQLTSIVLGSGQMSFTNLFASNNSINQIQGTANVYFLFLDLGNNELAGDLSPMLNVQTDLQYLDLSDNSLTNVGNLGNRTQLSSIYLQNNNLTTIGSMKTAYGDGNGSLYNLDLQGNTCFNCNSLEIPTIAWQTFNCSCNNQTCTTCN